MHPDTVAYNQRQEPADRVICELLAREIDRNLPDAENKVWHGHPVWFLDGNPVAGYSKLKNCVRLLFWSGQSFDEPGLKSEGSFKAAESRYTAADQVDLQALQRWLAKARDIQWDYKNIVRRKGKLERLRSIVVLLLSLPFLACETQSSERPVAEPHQPAARVEPGPELLTPDGWGPLRIGMSRAEVVQAAGEDANPDAMGGPDPAACDEFRPADAPDGVLVMVERGVLTRISVSRNAGIASPEGIRVGDPAATVLARYGARAIVEPHKYSDPPAKYVTVWDPEGPDAERRGIRYEIDATERVLHMRAGGASITYVEGCL